MQIEFIGYSVSTGDDVPINDWYGSTNDQIYIVCHHQQSKVYPVTPVALTLDVDSVQNGGRDISSICLIMSFNVPSPVAVCCT